MGFILEPNEALSLLEKDPKNREVIFPYLNGENLNTHPDQLPSRWVIQFDERSEEEARSYPLVWSIVEQRVKPERLMKDDKKYPRMVYEWWKHWNNRRELRDAIDGLNEVLVRARVSDTHGFVFVPSSYIFADQLVILTLPSSAHFAVVQSEIHNWWYRPLTSSLRTDVRYSPTDCFETFPFPENLQPLEDTGAKYHELRRHIMQNRREGLTKIYHRFHDKNEKSEDIAALRELHIGMDQAVATAYGWTDLSLDHSFRTTKQGIRFTISDNAQHDVFDRLLSLNHVCAGRETLGRQKRNKRHKRELPSDEASKHQLPDEQRKLF
jgi:hypothetical protein